MQQSPSPTVLVDTAEVRRIAQLARLPLSDAEAEAMVHDLSAILAHVARLNELDTQHVAATAHAVDLPANLRADVCQPSMAVEQGLRNAPQRIGDGFGVPKVID